MTVYLQLNIKNPPLTGRVFFVEQDEASEFRPSAAFFVRTLESVATPPVQTTWARRSATVCRSAF